MKQDYTSWALLQDVIDASVSNIAILDEDRIIVCVNRAWREFASQTGSLSSKIGIGRQYPDACIGAAAASGADAIAIIAGIETVIAREESSFEMEFRCIAVPEPLWFRLHAEGFLLRDEGRFLVLVSHNDGK